MIIYLKKKLDSFKLSCVANFINDLSFGSQMKFSKNLNNFILLTLILVSLINNSDCISLTNKNRDETQSIKEFNLEFKKFIEDFKSKNVKFNLSNVNAENLVNSINNELRKRREISLEEELEYVLKNKNMKNIYNFEREPKSIEQNSNEFNSLEDKSIEYNPETCVNCKSHDFLKKLRVQQIREEILRKLNLDKPPSVNLSSIPKQLILKSFQKKDSDYQNDQATNDFISDDEDVHIKQVITFSTPAPSYLKLEENVQYFPLSKEIYNTQIIESELNFNVFTTHEFDSLNNTANVKVYRIERTENGDDVEFLVAEKTLNVVGTSAWITVDVNDLVSYWVENKDKNYGLVIHCYNSFGKKFAQNRDEGNTFIKTSHRGSKRTKVKRAINDCSKDSDTSMCCRFPLTINFKELDFDFIVHPESYEAFYCGGKCKFGHSKNKHSNLMYHANKSSSICCHGQKYSGISIIYFKDNQAVYTELNNMVVNRCGCS